VWAMAKPDDIQDPAFRSAVEEAERLLDEGDYLRAAQTCAETYLKLLARRPDLIPPPDLPDVQPLNPTGQPRIAEGTQGLSRIDAARAARRNWWPGTGAISVVVDPDRTPRIQYAKQRVSLAEAAGYFEFLVEQLANAQHSS
jgi:hypothetical protein